MVGKVDQILEKMRSGVPVEEIDDSSKSSYYKALDIYKPEADTIYKKISNDIKVAKSQKAAIDSEVNQGKSELNAVRQTLTVEKKHLEETLVTKAAAKEETDALQAKSATMNSRLGDLEKRGITEATLDAVAVTDVTSPAGLLSRVKTAKDNQLLVKANEGLEAKNAKLSSDLTRGTVTLEGVKKETLSEMNTRDEFRRINAIYMILLDLLFDFFKHGYTEQDFKTLLNGLRSLEIIGQPKVSVARLLQALQKIRVLEELDAAIQTMEAKLKALQGKVNELQGIINAYRDVAVAALNEVSGAATQRINDLLGQYVASMNLLQDKLVKGMTAMNAASDAERAAVARVFYNELRTAKNEVLNIHLNVTQALKLYKDEVGRWGALREESGRYEKLIEYASALLATTKDPNIIKQLPPEIIISLLRGLDIYIQVRLPDAETMPSPALQQKDRWAFSSTFRAKVRNVSAWLLEDLTRRFYEGQL